MTQATLERTEERKALSAPAEVTAQSQPVKAVTGYPKSGTKVKSKSKIVARGRVVTVDGWTISADAGYEVIVRRRRDGIYESSVEPIQDEEFDAGLMDWLAERERYCVACDVAFTPLMGDERLCNHCAGA
jgi:hypothetical protein